MNFFRKILLHTDTRFHRQKTYLSAIFQGVGFQKLGENCVKIFRNSCLFKINDMKYSIFTPWSCMRVNCIGTVSVLLGVRQKKSIILEDPFSEENCISYKYQSSDKI